MGRKLAIALAVALAGYLGLGAWAVARQDIQPLLLCADSGGMALPLSRQWCRAYLFSFRGTPEDIDALHRGVGASFVVQGEAPAAERAQVLAFLVERGLDPNRIDMHGATALHAAVLAGALDQARLLLAHGARTDIPAMTPPVTALQLARRLQQRQPADPARAQMLRLLSEHADRA